HPGSFSTGLSPPFLAPHGHDTQIANVRLRRSCLEESAARLEKVVRIVPPQRVVRIEAARSCRSMDRLSDEGPGGVGRAILTIGARRQDRDPLAIAELRKSRQCQL